MLLQLVIIAQWCKEALQLILYLLVDILLLTTESAGALASHKKVDL